MRLSFIKTLLVGAYTLITLNAHAQYSAGFAEASIEPGKYPFSLALAGYGAPRDGRFSIEWIRQAGLLNITAVAGSSNKLYVLNNNQILQAKVGAKLVFQKLCAANKLQYMAAAKTQLIGVDSSGNVLAANYTTRNRWRNIGMVKNVVAITAANDHIFIADEDGMIRQASVKVKNLKWKKLSQVPGAIAIAAYNNMLYVLTKANDIYKPDDTKASGWLKIARFNGTGYDVKLKALAIANNTIYGVDSSGNVFAGRHQTEGDLKITALAVGQAKTKVVLVGVDVCGFNGDFINSVKQEAANKYGVQPSALLINASHTHFAPVTQRWLTWGEHVQLPDSFYLYKVVKPALIKAIGGALKNMSPSTLTFSRGKTAIGGNRSLKTAPLPYDNDVDVLTVTRSSDNKKTLLFLAGCHAVFRNEGAEGVTISANFPGVTRRQLQEQEDIQHAMFIQGCGGDINPMSDDYHVIGKQLANDVLSAANLTVKQLKGAISFYIDSVNFPVQKWDKQQLMAFKNSNINIADVYAEKNVRWANLMLKLDSLNRVPTQMPVYVQTINIGDWKLVGLSREAVTDYSIGIKQLWPGKIVSVAGYCNDVSSYLPTQKHIDAQVYEGHDSFFWYGQPAVFPADVYLTILQHIKNQNH